MIGIKGKYVAHITIDGKEFLTQDSLESLKIIEEAGNVLPSFEISFTTSDSLIRRKLNEGSPITVAIGKSENKLFNIRLKVLKKTETRLDSADFLVKASGLYDAITYLTDSRISISDKTSSISLAKSIVNKYFLPDFSTDSSLESMNWIQPNVPDKFFVNELWMHAHLDKDFPLVGITSDGIFRLKTYKSLLTEKPAFKFQAGGSFTDGVLAYDSDYSTETDSGFINYWLGYEKSQLIYNLDDGSADLSTPNLDQLLALTGSIERAKEVGRRAADATVTNENLSETFFDDYAFNLASVASLSTVRLTLRVSSYYFQVRVLDLVSFMDDNSNANQTSNDVYSGLWVVSKVVRDITRTGQLDTTVILCRESMNNVRGDVK